MGIKADPRPPKRDWLTSVTEAAKIPFAIAELNPFRLLSAVRGSINGFSASEQSLHQLVWQLWENTIQIAALDWVIENALFSEDALSVEEHVNAFLLQDATRPLTLEAAHLSSPYQIPNLRSAEKYFLSVYKDKKPAARFERVFQSRWFEQLAGNHIKFAPLISALTTEGKLGADRLYQWGLYHDWLRREFEDKPLFGQSNNGITLSQIYTPLRCTWIERTSVDNESLNTDEDTASFCLHIADLEQTLVQWLHTTDRYDDVRVITGGPGSGKSSTAKALAANLAKDQNLNVFFVPLQGLDISTDVQSVIDQYVRLAKSSSDLFEENPLNQLRQDKKPLLIIFDGLDEVRNTSSLHRDDETAKFVQKVRTFIRQINDHRDQYPVFSIILGRPAAAEEAAQSVGLPPQNLLRVAPLSPLKVPETYQYKPLCVADPLDLAAEDQRPIFLKKYAVAANSEIQSDKLIKNKRLQDLSSEPLLLYLLSFSDILTGPHSLENIKRNVVYKRIFEKLHRRDADEKRSDIKDSLSIEDFMTLMECFGVAAWMRGGRVGSTEEYVKIRDELYAARFRDRFSNMSSASLKNVALQFYTQPTGSGEVGYEFIHKSFGDYFVSRAILKYANFLAEMNRVSGQIENLASSWGQMVGARALMPEHISWISEEVFDLYEDSEDGIKAARRDCNDLIRIFSWSLDNGLPTHKLDVQSFNDARKRNENGICTLLICINAIARFAYRDEHFETNDDLSWKAGPLSLGQFDEIRRVEANNTDELWNHFGVPALDYLLDFWARSMHFPSLVPLDYFNFSKLNLGHCRFVRTSMNFTSFESTSLIGTEFHSVNLRGADFSGSAALHSSFVLSDVKDARFNGANLEHASFRTLATLEPQSINPKILKVDLKRAEETQTVNLTREQLRQATLLRTRLPFYLM